MKLTLSQYEKTYTIECKFDDLTLEQVRDELLIPMLAAAGFNAKSIQEMFFEEPEVGFAFNDPVPPEID